MKNAQLLFAFCICLFCSVIKAQQSESPRKKINFNREWKYAHGDVRGAERIGYNDSGWETVGVPHSFSIPYFMSKDFYVGYGWYRKSFRLSEDDLKKCTFIEFDGVFQEAEIYINGQKVGSHVGGYTGFSVDVTKAVKAGNNEMAVRVNNIWKPDVAPRAGEHVFSGGIYRNVRLVQKSKTYIDWYGTFVITPELKENRGKASTVKVATEVCNRSSLSSEYKLVTEVRKLNGEAVTSVTTTEYVGANDSKQFVQVTPAVNEPELWHPAHPSLYKLVSLLYKGNELLDSEETVFGFRWFEWTADRGFFLNGEHLFFKGANVHQDQAGWGDAVTEAAMRRDVKQMKEAGFDFIRGSHYPHAPAFSKACDEMGMLFWAEAPFWGIGGFGPDGYWNSSAYPVYDKHRSGFDASALQQLGEMIRIHRNHPSIVAWSMCNEAFFSAPEAMDGVRELLKKMVALSHQLDPTRPAAIGGAQRPLGVGRIDKLGDIGGYNGDGATQPDFLNPGIPGVVSEYGSTTADRPGEYMPGWGDLEKNDGWKGYEWRSGQAIWCGFDHGSIAGSQLGKMGIVDYFRIPKRSWYWYRNEYNHIAPPEWAKPGIPAKLKLEADKTMGIRIDGTDDVQLTVTVLDAQGKEISNSPEVTLKLVAGPGEFPTGTSITFKQDSDIRIQDGKAAIAFRSYYAGKTLIEASSPGLVPARVELVFEGAPQYVPNVTPQVRERPYVRYASANRERPLQTFGRNNPTFTGSQSEGYVAALAADGNVATWWQAAKGDASPYWLLDTEKGLDLQQITLVFPQTAVYRFRVEVSDDRKEWRVIEDMKENRTPVSRYEIQTDAGKVKGRFVRISFMDNTQQIPAALAEVTVLGFVRE